MFSIIRPTRLIPFRLPTSLRTLSTTATMAQKHEWIVILPDNAGALEKRMSVRQYVSFPLFPSSPFLLEISVNVSMP